MRGNIRRRIAIAAAAFGLTAAMPSAASAALVNANVPSNAYITYNGFDWAWAGPTGPDSGAIDLSFQSGFGWRLPTAQELLLAPVATQFIFVGANVPLGGSDPISGANFQFTDVTLSGAAALATPYFNNTYFHGDWCNAPGSNCTNQNSGFEMAWNSPTFISETIVLRAANGAVPEPATWAMMLLGFGAMGIALRRRTRMAVPQTAA